MKKAHIIYEGMVQGVGFRYTVIRLARDMVLTGWVRNLTDGSVEVLAEGEEEGINKLCGSIEAHFESNLTNIKKDVREADREFNSFQIAF